MNTLNNTAIEVHTMKASVHVLDCLLSHGYTWFNKDTKKEFLPNPENLPYCYYINNNKISWGKDTTIPYDCNLLSYDEFVDKCEKAVDMPQAQKTQLKR